MSNGGRIPERDGYVLPLNDGGCVAIDKPVFMLKFINKIGCSTPSRSGMNAAWTRCATMNAVADIVQVQFIRQAS